MLSLMTLFTLMMLPALTILTCSIVVSALERSPVKKEPTLKNAAKENYLLDF